MPALLQDGRKNVFLGELAGEHQGGEHQDGQFQSAAMGHDRHNSFIANDDGERCPCV